jgi:quercetin dioxygenase-like cupin family protein
MANPPELRWCAVAASPDTGVNTITGEGLNEAMAGAQVVIDLANSPSFEDRAVLAFFETSGRNLLAAEAAAGVRHHVALSIVGTDRTPDNGYFRAKVAQEQLIEASSIPYTIIRSTQFLEFLPGKSIKGVLVEYGPGGYSPGHTHPKSAFIYATVLEGAIRSQVNDGPVTTYEAGQIFSELPGDRHRVSANASETKPAKILAVFVVDTHETELTIPFGN